MIRVPDSKSMPKLIPSPAMARAPTTRITPENEKNQRELPMKSNFQPSRSPRVRTPSALGRRSRRERESEPRIADVASTAVNSDTSVPTPSVKAKPLTPAVASVNRMNATPIVTTFASMIARSAFVYPAEMAAGMERPPRTSSFIRSYITMLASAATASVSTIPAMPGSVSVIGISLISANRNTA